MSNSLRDVKVRIQATRKTSQITKAMNVVSASKLRRAEQVYRDYRDFMKRFNNLVHNIASMSDADVRHPMLHGRKVNTVGYILITSDRGLAGPYNANLFKALLPRIENDIKEGKDVILGTVGRKGFTFVNKKNLTTINESPILIRDDIMFIDIVNLANDFISLYNHGEIDQLVVCHNHFVNVISQEVNYKQLLPIEAIEGTIDPSYNFEDGIEMTLDAVLPMYVQNILYGLILDSKTSEHAARMTAMKSATDNAKDVINQLQLIYNRARQEAITKELIDIVGGASAVE